MRMGRRMAVNSGGSESYTFYDYIKHKYTSTHITADTSKGIMTPVFNTDVLIRTIWMPIVAEQSVGTIGLLVQKAYGSSADIYGAGVRASYVSRYSIRGLLYLETTRSSEAEQVVGWMEDDQWYETEIRMSLNEVSGQNYIKIGSNQATYGAGTGKTDFNDPWVLFGFNGDSRYWTEHSQYSNYANGAAAVQRTLFYDYTGTNLLADLKPCLRGSDGAMGMFDTVSGEFFPAKEGSVIQIVTDPDKEFELGNL